VTPSSSPFPSSSSPLPFPPLLRLQLPLWRPHLPLWWRPYSSPLAIYPISTALSSPPLLQIIRSTPLPIIPNFKSTSFLKFLDLVFSKPDLFTSGSFTPRHAIPPYSRASQLLAATKNYSIRPPRTGVTPPFLPSATFHLCYRPLRLLSASQHPLPARGLHAPSGSHVLAFNCIHLAFLHPSLHRCSLYFCYFSVAFLLSIPDSFPLFLRFRCSCYPTSVEVALKGILQVMPLFTPTSLTGLDRVKGKGLVTSCPCLCLVSQPLLATKILGVRAKYA
jgi:hypothetical protein